MGQAVAEDMSGVNPKVNTRTSVRQVAMSSRVGAADMSRLIMLALTSFSAMGQLAGCAAVTGRGTQPRDIAPAGTYRVTVCRGSCAGGRGTLVAEGILVLEAQSFSIEEIPQQARGYFEKYENILLHEDAGDAPNACFALRSLKSGTLAGSTPAGLTRWTRTAGDSIRLRLYHSADAGYDVRLSVRAEGVEGYGQSWGPWPPSENSPSNVIVARRIGPPNRDPCIHAAVADLQLLQR